MIEAKGESLWVVDPPAPGPTVCLSFGVHGNERPPIVAGLELLRRIETGELALTAGKLLLSHSNPRASAQDRRWSEGGVDLNRCFHPDVLAREPELYEEHRAREVARFLENEEAEVLVDFHCTVEPGDRFLLQHPGVDDADHARVHHLLSAEVLLADPALNFGGVSLDEYMATRGRVGICYETGWIRDPRNTPAFVLEEMTNLLAGLGLLGDRRPRLHDTKRLLQLDHVIRCEGEGFRWREGVGTNLQALPAGTVLGEYQGGRTVALEFDAVLVFPKKRPELVERGKPLVYLGRAHAGAPAGAR